MATFWTGSALAADYGQQNILALRRAARAAEGAMWTDQLRKRHSSAFTDLNLAISTAVLAQLDDQLAALCDNDELPVDDTDDEAALHGGCLECFTYARMAARPSLTG